MIRKLSLAILLFASAQARTARAAPVPRVLTEEGRLADASGNPLTGSASITFTVYDAATGGTALWAESHTLNLRPGGYFSVQLGVGVPFPADAFDGSQRFLGVQVNTDPEMSPRQAIASVPYALLANDVPGDIHPTSVSVNGTTVIDSNGNWVGSPTGLQGPTGPAGAQGLQGPTGPQGVQGDTGPTGAQGPQGDVGPTGPQGPQGDVGPTGAQGLQGDVGPAGPIGPKGDGFAFQGAYDASASYFLNDVVTDQGSAWVATGAVLGAPGTPGSGWSLFASRGDVGPQGAVGPTGPQGPQGLTGAQGPQGPMGPMGPQGIPGAQGQTGATGAQGPQGQTGPTGPQGQTGATGAQGPAGPAGASGANALIATTVEPNGANCATGGVKVQAGLDANGNGTLDATEVGQTRYVCNGAQGPQGPQGQTGQTGATGPQGPVGQTGATGAQGPVGQTGATGAQGPQGQTGATGATGASGTDALIATSVEPNGTNCATGGIKVQAGLDANRNGTLDATEVNASLTRYVCNGAQGPQGQTGQTGATGPQGPAGTFSGSFSGNATFTGGTADFTGETAVKLPASGVTFGGNDLFTASHQGEAPAVIGQATGTTVGSFSCGAPAALDVTTSVSAGNINQAAASFGPLVYTQNGAFNLTQYGPPGNAFTTACGTSNFCFGPVTFFVKNTTAAALTVTLKGYLDNGASPIYLDGAKVVTDAAPTIGAGQNVSIPTGAHALSIVACSNDGPSTGFVISNAWLTTPGLVVDFDRTYHRNGQ